jgi:hypothetical protein
VFRLSSNGEAMALKVGDKVWIEFSDSDIGAVECEIVRVLPASVERRYRIKFKRPKSGEEEQVEVPEAALHPDANSAAKALGTSLGAFARSIREGTSYGKAHNKEEDDRKS